MTTGDPSNGKNSEAKIAPETLELRARPLPVTRVNRKVLIGGAAVLLFVISALVLVALKPPSLRIAASSELFRVDHKPITDGLSKLPATYDGVKGDIKTEAPKLPPKVARDVPTLTAPPVGDPVAEAERVEKARLARMAGQAPVSFRLQLKAQPRPEAAARPDPIARPSPIAWDGDLTSLSALRAAERGRVLAAGDGDVLANDPSDQTRKLSFLKSAPEKEIYNLHGLQRPASPYQLMAGTIISASMVSGLNSDLPGFVIAQVTENVYDTVSGRYLLIPQASRLLGKYDNVVAFGQERALVVWQRIILPDGSSIVIDNLPATDTGGYAGLADQVDLHTWQLLKGVALATVLGVGSQLAVGTGSSSDSDLVKALQQSVQSTTNRAGQRLVERNLNVQPTITVRPGWPLRVIVHKDIVFPYRAPSSP
jgi:type IV secretory pathway VirB10-like protein